ncbi:hypothetical protein BSKO_04252 [Bryopsis sp. KO-2023]|nr:hypothetical protein BSKO_04252 [Bryopsis sp. KO-2023]
MLEVGSSVHVEVSPPVALPRLDIAEGFIVRHNQLFEEKQSSTKRREADMPGAFGESPWCESYDRGELERKSLRIPTRALLAGIGLIFVLGGAKSCLDMASWAWGLQRDMATLLNDVAELKKMLEEARLNKPVVTVENVQGRAQPTISNSLGDLHPNVEFGRLEISRPEIKDEFFAALNASDWVKMVEIIEERWDVVNARDDFGATPLKVAARKGHHDVCKFLVHHGAQLQVRDFNGETALHEACRYGHLMTVSALISLGADVRIADQKLSTPLHVASQNCFPHVAKVLIGCGAERRARNADHKSAFDVTCQSREGGPRIREQKRMLHAILQY